MDKIDKDIINHLQNGFPVCENPYAVVAEELHLSEMELIERIQNLLEQNTLTRFGPMYNADRMGGAFSLVAMSVPEERFEEVSQHVNALKEVAHNYQRNHKFNMWFVLATETPEQIDIINSEIERQTGLPVYNMPKLREFYVSLRFQAV